jgi:hypothetical protein
MASYKVPQDVEADDKLLGPFSFRQFIYLLIVAAAVGLGFVLFKILPPLVIIPLPFVLFFGALALPLRKDQPMEIYLAAIMSFYLKPRMRIWEPDGIETLIQIAAPRTKEVQRTKDISESEAERRLRYLSDLSDSRGWSVRNTHEPVGSSLNADVFNEAQQTQDVLDESGTIAQNLTQMITQNDQIRHQQMMSQFQAAAAAPIQPPQPVAPPIPDPYATLGQPQQIMQPSAQSTQTVQPQVIQQPQMQPQPTVDPFAGVAAPQFNPYPTNMNQSVIQPLSVQQQVIPQPTAQPQLATQQVTAQLQPQPEEVPVSTSTNMVSPDIINLATNSDLSIETIAREAQRITKKNEADLEEEVVISLR